MTSENRQALNDLYMAKAKGLIRASAKPLIQQSTRAAVAQNQQVHDQKAKSQDKREVMSGGKPAPTPIAVVPPNANLDTKMDSFWKQQDAASRR